ncbi:pyruvate orthophosphate dikinase [Trifolium repens]|nr:pyruvate orthophosphate dikinase [Trifolium repens]
MFVNAYKNALALAVVTEYSFPEADKVKEYLKDPSKFAVAAVAAASGGAPAAAKEEVNKEEPEEESDDDIDERLKAVRMMIMAVTLEQRKTALDLLLPYQRSDFEGIFRAMDGLPVTIRLLDPLLREFIPKGDMEQISSELTSLTDMKKEEIFSRIEKLSEVNPNAWFSWLQPAGKDATVDFEDVGHSDSAIEIMEKYFVGEVDTTTLPAEAKNNTPPPVQATTLNYQSSGFFLKFLQYLVPLFILGFAFALQYYGKKKQVQ